MILIPGDHEHSDAFGVIDSCEVGTILLRGTAPLVLRMSRVTGYPFLATASSRRKSAPQ